MFGFSALETEARQKEGTKLHFSQISDNLMQGLGSQIFPALKSGVPAFGTEALLTISPEAQSTILLSTSQREVTESDLY